MGRKRRLLMPAPPRRGKWWLGAAALAALLGAGGGAAAGEPAASPVPSASPAASPGAQEAELAAEFARRLAVWQAYIRQPEVALRSDPAAYRDNPAFARLVALGPRIAPLLIARLEEEPFLRLALEELTGWRPPASASPRPAAAVWREWWAQGRPRLAGEFAAAWVDWRRAWAAGERRLFSVETALDGQGGREERRRTTPLGEAWTRLAGLGRGILPYLAERLAAGEYDLLPLFGELTGGLGVTAEGDGASRAAFAAEWWARNRASWELPDTPPLGPLAPTESPGRPASPPAGGPPAAPAAPPGGGAAALFLAAAGGLLAGSIGARLLRRRA